MGMDKIKALLVIFTLLAITFRQYPCYARESIPDKVTTAKEKQREKSKVQLHSLGAEPNGILAKTTTDALFTVLLTGAETPPDRIQLQQIDEKGYLLRTVGFLMDNGKDRDLSCKDGIYSGVFSINSDTEGKLYYRAQFRYDRREYLSCPYSLTVTSFPIGPLPSDPNFIVTDPMTGQKLYSNEIIVSFVEGTSESRVKEIVAERKAYIAGTIPSLGVIQLRILGDSTATGVYTAIKAFTAYKEVQYAEPNYVVELDEQ